MLPQNNKQSLSSYSDNKAIWFIIFLLTLFLAGNFVFTQYEFTKLKNSFLYESRLVTTTPVPNFIIQTPFPTYTPKGTFLPTITPTPQVIYVTPAQVSVPKITYIPLTGGSTQSTDWVTVSGSQFNLNISDYGTKAYAVWDANLRVGNANGTTFVRLYDTTHSIGVNGSEIFISDTGTSTDVISGSLSFWLGNNTYVVQIKSLNSSTAFMDSGRIKISY